MFVDRSGPTLAPVAPEGQALTLHRAVLVLWRARQVVGLWRRWLPVGRGQGIHVALGAPEGVGVRRSPGCC